MIPSINDAIFSLILCGANITLNFQNYVPHILLIFTETICLLHISYPNLFFFYLETGILVNGFITK